MRLKVGRLASSPVVSVEMKCLVSTGLQLMSARRVSCLIVSSGGEPVGILTERDIVFAANWMLGQSDITIGQVMNKEVITISKNISIRKVCEIFRDNSIRHLVIVDGQSQAAGIFTLSDLMRALGKKALVPDSSVAAIMSSKVWQVEPGTTARYALSLMARHAISGVVVVKEGKPLGFFTERDVVRMITGGSDLMHDLVGDVLTSPAVCLSVEASPREAAALMQSKSVRRLVILDSQAEIAGILTKTDLSRSLDCCQLFGQPPLD